MSVPKRYYFELSFSPYALTYKQYCNEAKQGIRKQLAKRFYIPKRIIKQIT